ncbi:hypothetical protein HYX14_06570 [Candidatus Woesearchaeota archaeon]|nr:hypothetical protein [Candidatus Woesearchaeota archaeon]
MVEKLLSKVVMITFLVMIVIGFTIPSFLQSNDGKAAAEQRICQTDTECYLMCEDIPVAILCSGNLCIQNSCKEKSLYPFQQNPLAFSLGVEVDGQTVNLTANPNNFFVKFNPTEIFSSGISLNQILDKAGMRLEGLCLQTPQGKYCNEKEKEVQVWLNGNRTYNYNYVPVQGDTIKIIYTG